MRNPAEGYMLYEFLYPLSSYFTALNIFRYITFRTIYGGLTAFLICFLFGTWAITILKKMQIKQIVQSDGPQSHQVKQGTPTMGGLLILASIILSLVTWGNLSNHYVLILLLTIVLFGAIGFVDDYLMLIRKRNMGLTARCKFFLQVICGLFIGYLIYMSPDFNSTLSIPFFKGFQLDLGGMYVPFACLVMVATSNAVKISACVAHSSSRRGYGAVRDSGRGRNGVSLVQRPSCPGIHGRLRFPAPGSCAGSRGHCHQTGSAAGGCGRPFCDGSPFCHYSGGVFQMVKGKTYFQNGTLAPSF